jgi:hypothetical protein
LLLLLMVVRRLEYAAAVAGGMVEERILERWHGLWYAGQNGVIRQWMSNARAVATAAAAFRPAS